MKEILIENLGVVTLVDDADHESLSQRKWHGRRSKSDPSRIYVSRAHHFTPSPGVYKTRQLSMHRVIMGVTDPKIKVDHKNGDALDNRRENLRIATPQQNSANRKVSKNNKLGLKGVCYVPATGKYRAQLQVAKKKVFSAEFDCKESAYTAYLAECVKHNGEFARLP